MIAGFLDVEGPLTRQKYIALVSIVLIVHDRSASDRPRPPCPQSSLTQAVLLVFADSLHQEDVIIENGNASVPAVGGADAVEVLKSFLSAREIVRHCGNYRRSQPRKKTWTAGPRVGSTRGERLGLVFTASGTRNSGAGV